MLKERRTMNNRKQDKAIMSLQKTVEDHGSTLAEIKGILAKMDEKLTPIADTYLVTRTLGKWTMGILVFISLVVGIVIEARHFLNK